MLLLTRSEIASLLTLDDYIRVVEEAFRNHAEGGSFTPALAHVDAEGGEFHIKAGGVRGNPPYFGVKVNGGFFQNRARHGLPNIQGLIVLSRADNGVPLAVLDSIEITIQRTGASTAVAAKYLARPDSRVCIVCGCGNQARIQLRALSRVLHLERVFAWSPIHDPAEADAYANEMSRELGIPVMPSNDLPESLAQSDVCVTCTPSRAPFIRRSHVRPGTFIAAVGADSPDKQELDADLTARSKVIADIRDQAIAVGETHHAIQAGLVSPEHVHADLGEIITGQRSGRASPEEIIIFDSTGTALQDVASAAAVYERAVAVGCGTEWQSS
ncbi:MAG: ornithine cyclodeaminase family protein [Bryobacteraceae bacterium]